MNLSSWLENRSQQTTVLAIDGPSGSGKTQLANNLSSGFPGACLIHLDDLLSGWTGFETQKNQLLTTLPKLLAGESAEIKIYDWTQKKFSRTQLLQPSNLIILEGVGAGAGYLTGYVDCLVWVYANKLSRSHRVLTRDQITPAELTTWQNYEDQHFEMNQTSARANFQFNTDQTSD